MSNLIFSLVLLVVSFSCGFISRYLLPEISFSRYTLFYPGAAFQAALRLGTLPGWSGQYKFTELFEQLSNVLSDIPQKEPRVFYSALLLPAVWALPCLWFLTSFDADPRWLHIAIMLVQLAAFVVGFSCPHKRNLLGKPAKMQVKYFEPDGPSAVTPQQFSAMEDPDELLAVLQAELSRLEKIRDFRQGCIREYHSCVENIPFVFALLVFVSIWKVF